jgi:hypothetical protein
MMQPAMFCPIKSAACDGTNGCLLTVDRIMFSENEPGCPPISLPLPCLSDGVAQRGNVFRWQITTAAVATKTSQSAPERFLYPKNLVEACLRR